MAYKCSKCSADLSFDISNNNLKCDYCKTNYEIPKNNIINNYIIPFKVNKNEAIDLYKNLIKSKLLTPQIFKDINNINKIDGVYIPTRLCDMAVSGTSENKANKISSWKSSGKTYEKTDVYSVVRSGSMVLKDVPVSCSKLFKNEDFDNIGTYNYKEKVLYDNSYLNNYKIYKTDKSYDEILESINLRARNLFSNELIKDIKGYNSSKNINSIVTLKIINEIYILIPVWILSFNYKNKKYSFYINGQNKKIYGTIPLNIKRLIKLWIFIFIIVFIILLLINLLGVIFL